MYKFKNSRFGRRLIALGLSLAIALTCIPYAGAITQADIDKLKDKQAAVESQMNDLENELASLKRKENSAIEQIRIYQEKMDLLSTQIFETQVLIGDLEVQIADTQVELAKAQEKATTYYQIFCERTRDLEESGSFTYWSILFDAASFSDLLDRINFIRDVANYDNNMADTLEAARKEVADTEAQLQTELDQQQTLLTTLEYQIASIEAASIRTNELLEEIAQNRELYAEQLDKLESENDDLESSIVDAEEELRRQKEAEEELRRQEEANKNNNNNGGSGNTDYKPNNTTGSAAAKELANYACTFIGKLDYVWGGTSLTTGADCSGFAQAIYKKWGIYLPRTSWSQAQCGTAVSYANAQPGDLVFYKSSASASGGHVGIYIGDGKMVSALGAKWGVKITTVNPNKSGLTIRRLL